MAVVLVVNEDPGVLLLLDVIMVEIQDVVLEAVDNEESLLELCSLPHNPICYRCDFLRMR